MDLCDDPVLKLCMFLAIGCSMRIGEILGLTRDCVWMDDESIANDDAYVYVEKELKRGNKQSLQELREKGRDDVFLEFPGTEAARDSESVLILKPPKTECSVRRVYLPKTAADALRAAQECQKGLKYLLDHTGRWTIL